MSIRKNNKQVAGNYTNLNIKNYTNMVNETLNNVIDTGNTQVENISKESTEKISQMNDILSTVESTANNKISQMDGILVNIIDTGDIKVKEINNTASTQIEEINNTANTQIEEMNAISDRIIQFAKVVGANTIGTEKVWRGETAPKNYLFMDGQEVSRIEYASLYQWAIDNNLIVEDSIWKDYKKYGLYSHGDNETTFRLPKMTGYYLVGYDPEHHTELAVEQSDMLPNITGSLTLQGTNNSSLIGSSNATGVFNINTKETSAYPITGSTTLTDELVDTIDFDLSREFNTGDRVQPRSIPVKYIVCYKNIWDDI